MTQFESLQLLFKRQSRKELNSRDPTVRLHAIQSSDLLMNSPIRVSLLTSRLSFYALNEINREVSAAQRMTVQVELSFVELFNSSKLTVMK